MAIKIEVHEKDAQALVDFYLNKLRMLKEEINVREEEARSINAMIVQLNKGSKPAKATSVENKQDGEYHAKWTWIKKIKFALAIQNHSMTTNEIVDTLTDYEPSFLFERKRAVASVSSVLSLNFGPKKEFIRSKEPSGEYKYDIREKFAGADNDNQLVVSKK